MLYIQDEGSKELDKVYIDKNSGVMYKCIKTTTNQSNTEEFFSRVDIGNIYDRFGQVYGLYYAYYNSNRDVIRPYEDAVKVIVNTSSNSFASKIDYTNINIFRIGYCMIFQVNYQISFEETLPFEERFVLPNDSNFYISFPVDVLLKMCKVPYKYNVQSGRGRVPSTVTITSTTESGVVNDYPGVVAETILTSDGTLFDTQFSDLSIPVPNHENNRISKLSISFTFSVGIK